MQCPENDDFIRMLKCNVVYLNLWSTVTMAVVWSCSLETIIYTIVGSAFAEGLGEVSAHLFSFWHHKVLEGTLPMFFV